MMYAYEWFYCPDLIEVDQHSSMRNLIVGNVLFWFCF